MCDAFCSILDARCWVLIAEFRVQGSGFRGWGCGSNRVVDLRALKGIRMSIERFEDNGAWQLARELTLKVYGLTKKTTFARDFGLKGQIQKK